METFTTLGQPVQDDDVTDILILKLYEPGIFRSNSLTSNLWQHGSPPPTFKTVGGRGLCFWVPSSENIRLDFTSTSPKVEQNVARTPILFISEQSVSRASAAEAAADGSES